MCYLRSACILDTSVEGTIMCVSVNKVRNGRMKIGAGGNELCGSLYEHQRFLACTKWKLKL